MHQALVIAKVVRRSIGVAFAARIGRFRSWPPTSLLIDAPLALAEERTNRLRRIYAHAARDAWDGPELFRQAMARHGGIQLARKKREALAHPVVMLTWGELAAWIVSAELAERLEDADARLAASGQVFDEARHFYTLRDYLAALHVPAPALDPYFAIGVRRLLMSHDLDLKLFTMQILAEGAAQAIFRFLREARVEPVLGDLLPSIERDEARHVGLGIVHLPKRLERLSRRKVRALASRVGAIGDLFVAAQVRLLPHYQALGADPRELVRGADRMLFELSRKLGSVPGTDEPFFRTDDPSAPGYEAKLDLVLPQPGTQPSAAARVLRSAIELGARALPS
jgi:hypothetical protein